MGVGGGGVKKLLTTTIEWFSKGSKQQEILSMAFN
jgi:hypothetical protein